MQKNFKTNYLKIYIIFLISIFTGLTYLQNSSNALPFFYKDYPTYENNGKKGFDSISESLILNRIDFETLQLDYKYKFNLWGVHNEKRGGNETKDYDKNYKTTPEYLMNGSPYRSQVGAQSLFFSQVAVLTSNNHGSYESIKKLSVLLLAIFLAIIMLWVKISFGPIPSIIITATVIASTGINIFSESLYWSIWLLIAPLSITCLLEILRIKNKLYIFLLTLPLFLFKFLSGYEFITIIVFAAMTPYMWDYFMNNNFSALMRSATVGFSSVTGFCISIFIYHTYFLQDFNLSGVDNIFGRSGFWSLKNLGELSISPWLQSAKILIINFIDINGYGIPLGVFLLLILTTLVLIRNKIHLKDLKFIGFLFFGSISWLILQPGHILHHPRYATLVFFIPFGFFITGFIASLMLKKKTLGDGNE